jgi:hypothetical protein
MDWWWLSFSGEPGFLGVCIVQGNDIGEAVIRAHVLGINPGGEVRGFPIPKSELHRFKLEACERLLNVADLEALGLEPRKVTYE